MINTFHAVSCDGVPACPAVGPSTFTRVDAWKAARRLGWTLQRATSSHYCPRCSGVDVHPGEATLPGPCLDCVDGCPVIGGHCSSPPAEGLPDEAAQLLAHVTATPLGPS